jgi:hypothetical protein
MSAPSFGTRGSQVKILPLRPALTSFAPGHSDRFPDRIKMDLAALWNAAAARLHAGNVIKSPRSPCELVAAPSRVIPLGSA